MHRGPPLLGEDAPTVFHYHRSPLGNWPEDQSAQLHQVGEIRSRWLDEMRRETRRKWVSGTVGREGPGSSRLFSRVMAPTA